MIPKNITNSQLYPKTVKKYRIGDTLIDEKGNEWMLCYLFYGKIALICVSKTSDKNYGSTYSDISRNTLPERYRTAVILGCVSWKQMEFTFNEVKECCGFHFRR